MTVYLHLLHGRNSVDEDMDDWGFDGPVIGPLEYVHVTYMCDVKMACDYETAVKFFSAEAEQHRIMAGHNNIGVNAYPINTNLTVTEGLIEYDGKFYGDWSVSTSNPNEDDGKGLPFIANEDHWLDLREGDEAFVQGKLTTASKEGCAVSLPSWNLIAIEGDTRHLRGFVDTTYRLKIRVVRTEDGLRFKDWSVVR